MLLIKKYFENHPAPKLFNKPPTGIRIGYAHRLHRLRFHQNRTRWQEFWEQNHTFRAIDGSNQPKFYALDMFPTRCAGLHIGHPEVTPPQTFCPI